MPHYLSRLLKPLALILFLCSCSDENPSVKSTPVTPKPFETDVEFWLTKSDRSLEFDKVKFSLLFKATTNVYPTITIDTTHTYQSMDGFGYTLTGGSAMLIHSLPEVTRARLLQELFATDSTYIGISYLRISIGASDLSETPYTYNDIATGQTDIDLAQFSLSMEQSHLIPLLKEILEINPDIKILGTPWSAPAWMKSNGSLIGGSLNADYYTTYANYLIKYLQGMAAEGIVIDAITPQNEPLNPNNNPSMLMTSAEQTNFIKNNLGPALANASLDTKIILYDHNCDQATYPLDILADPGANAFTDGSAFHLYAGDISVLGQVHQAYPDKNIYFTEQYTASTGDFGGDLKWHLKNLIVGASRNWSRNVLEWNLANNQNMGPHTTGGCTICLGALTINGSTISRNVSYYIMAHASKFVRPGSFRVDSNITSSLQNVAFQRPDGKKVLIVLNDGNETQKFNIAFKNKIVTPELAAGAVGTFVW